VKLKNASISLHSLSSTLGFCVLVHDDSWSEQSHRPYKVMLCVFMHETWNKLVVKKGANRAKVEEKAQKIGLKGLLNLKVEREGLKEAWAFSWMHWKKANLEAFVWKK
jgi:hypothetical protein